MGARQRAVFGIADVPLLTSAEMKAWDARAISRDGLPERLLIENAGRAVARVVQRLYPEGRVLGVVGKGNNGADALVALRALRSWGRSVGAILVADAQPAKELLNGWEIPIERDGWDRALRGCAVLLDGVLGTGVQGTPRDPQARAIREMCAAGVPVMALDGPSGLDLTTGQAAGEVVRAEVTVTFGAPKRGLLLYPGRMHAGRIIACEIGFPPLSTDEAGAAIITPAWAHQEIPAIPPNAHKGTNGNVVVVAGSPGVAGAAALVGTGAARSGAGKVYLVSAPENRAVLQTALPEAIFQDREADGVEQLLGAAAAIVAGPGMGTDEFAATLLRKLVASGEAPLLLDADALTILAHEPDLVRGAHRGVLLTPHPGEMSRLLGDPASEIARDPFRAAERAVERFGCAVLLKGAPSLVAAPGQRTMANVAGHSGIATGGMGDTLAGIAGALLAAGCSPFVAGALALYLSGRAAEIVGLGRSLLPRDVAEGLAAAFLEPEPVSDLGLPDVTLDLPPPI